MSISLNSNNEYKEYIDKIENSKLTPKQYIHLQNMLLDISKRDGQTAMKNSILKFLDKTIEKYVTENESVKIKKIKSKFFPNKTSKYYKKYKNFRNSVRKLPTIIEETDSKPKSRGGRNSRKNMKKQTNRLTW